MNRALVKRSPPAGIAELFTDPPSVGNETRAEYDRLFSAVAASQFKAIVGNPDAPPEAHSELNENLAKLERYERRAYSRRKRALREMT